MLEKVVCGTVHVGVSNYWTNYSILTLPRKISGKHKNI